MRRIEGPEMLSALKGNANVKREMPRTKGPSTKTWRREAGKKSIYIYSFSAFIKNQLTTKAESDLNLKLLKDQTAQLGFKRWRRLTL